MKPDEWCKEAKRPVVSVACYRQANISFELDGRSAGFKSGVHICWSAAWPEGIHGNLAAVRAFQPGDVSYSLIYLPPTILIESRCQRVFLKAFSDAKTALPTVASEILDVLRGASFSVCTPPQLRFALSLFQTCLVCFVSTAEPLLQEHNTTMLWKRPI